MCPSRCDLNKECVLVVADITCKTFVFDGLHFVISLATLAFGIVIGGKHISPV